MDCDIKNNKVIAGLLLGRAGSVGFPGKNTYPILGRPLMVYPMLAGLNSKYIDKMFFSTDSEEYKEIGRKHGLEIINRPPELATKQALGEDAFAHGYQVIKEFYKQRGKELELLVLFFCNSATILSETIDKGIEILRENSNYDSAVTVSAYNMWSPLRARRETSDGLLCPFVLFETFGDPKTLNCDRDSQGEVWFADMGVSIVCPRCLENLASGLLPQKWMGQKIYPIKQWGGCDVDFEWQIPGVVYWLEKHGFTENATPYDFKNFNLPVKKHLLDMIRIKNAQDSRLEYLRLDKNENLMPIPADFLQKIKESITAEFISAYPELDELYKKLANHLRIEQDRLYITAGSDAGIKAAFEVFVEPGDKVLTLEPTYAMYGVYIKMFQAISIPICYENDLCLDFNKIISQIKIQRPKLICIANPNSPTGTILKPDEIEQIVQCAAINDAIVLIDEAYYPYYNQTAIGLINRFPNLLITRTFSKAAAMAAARIGFVAACKKIIECLHKVRPMYETNAFAVRFAEFILDNPQIIENNLRETAAGKEYLEHALDEIGLPYFKSRANFINIRVESNEKSVLIEKQMRQQKILIKSGIANSPLNDCIRVSIGGVEQMRLFISVLKTALNDAKASELNYNVDDELLKYYANNRNTWEGLYPSEKFIFNKIILEEARAGDILDAGCACGGLGLALSEKIHIKKYAGIDKNARMITRARELFNKAEINHYFYSNDLLKCNELCAEYFDLVISLSCADWCEETENIIKACWERVKFGGRFIISLRLTLEKGINDITKSFQYIWYNSEKPIPQNAAKANYVVFNAADAIRMIQSLSPRPSKIFSYGEFHAPSFSARTPYNELFFAVFSAEKGATNEIPAMELSWPEKILKTTDKF